MATYINELRALMSTSTSTASDGAEPSSAHLEVKLREVLPNLLRKYVAPSPKAAGRLREVSAILKLVGFTALKFPGVFYNGRAADVLSVIARIITFLAEPNFRHCFPSPPFRLR